MAKITDPDDLNVGIELSIDTTAKTFTCNVSGSLVAKDGVTIQALYSKFVDLWLTSTYNKYPFPMYTIDALSGQYIFGFDGSTYSDWRPADTGSRQMLRDGGWSEYSSSGALNRQYVGIVSLGEVSTGSQLYYQITDGGSASNFTFQDEVNEGIQVYGASAYGNFDSRTYFKSYVREYGKKYGDSVLSDTGKTSTGAYLVNMLLSNETDLKIQATDATASAFSPYTGISVNYLSGSGFAVATAKSYILNEVGQDAAGRWFVCSNAGTLNAAGALNYTNNGGTGTFIAYTGEREIGGSYYAYNKIITGNSATAEDIYTKIQYLLRQTSDIDSGAGTVIGKTANLLLNFVGDSLITTDGVYIDGYDSNDINRLTFTDVSGSARNEPYTATGTLTFNSYLSSGGTGYYRMYFTDLPGANDYGVVGAMTVSSSAGAAIAGTINASSIAWTFDYDGNVQGGRTAATDASVTVVAGNAGSAKPVVTTYTITRATDQNISLVAEQDRAYLV